MFSRLEPRFHDLVRGRRALLVASTGGHLAQMVRLLPDLAVHPDSVLVTFESPQSRSLECPLEVRFIPYVPPRGYRDMLAAAPVAHRMMRDLRPEVVLSTGAGVAVPYLTAAASQGIDAVYLESVSRFDAPSLSGRLLAQVPAVSTFTPHPHLLNRRWRLGPSVLNQFQGSRDLAPRLRDDATVFVTLGTIRPYRFDRVLDRLASLVEPGWKVVWQLGCTTRKDLPGTSVAEVSSAEFDRLVVDSDVVVSHAGVGSALRMLELGRCPVLVPRDPRYGEHVDAHQRQIARVLCERGISQWVEADDLRRSHLEEAVQRRIVPGDNRPDGDHRHLETRGWRDAG